MNRSREQVLADILTAAREATTKTSIMYSARISYVQLLTHTKFLENQGMIKETKGGKWAVTDVGRDYLNYFEKITSLLKPRQLHTTTGQQYMEIK